MNSTKTFIDYTYGMFYGLLNRDVTAVRVKIRLQRSIVMPKLDRPIYIIVKVIDRLY